MTDAQHELDVRPILRAGGEPFTVIMDAVRKVGPGQVLRLLATFEPIPLYGVLAKKGFTYAAREIGGGDWEVVFTPTAAVARPQDGAPAPSSTGSVAQSAWPEPSGHLDNRELDPPEPLVRTLAAIERLQPGEVLSALLCREPVFLLPKLDERGHEWRGGFEADGKTYRLLVRKGTGREAAA